MAHPPICRVCPACGFTKYLRVEPSRLIAFVKDRQCKECFTRYARPTPLWAKLFFICFGVLAIGGFLLSIVESLMNGNMPNPSAALPALWGLACINFGVISFREKVIDAPTYAQRKPTPRPTPFDFLN